MEGQNKQHILRNIIFIYAMVRSSNLKESEKAKRHPNSDQLEIFLAGLKEGEGDTNAMKQSPSNDCHCRHYK